MFYLAVAAAVIFLIWGISASIKAAGLASESAQIQASAQKSIDDAKATGDAKLAAAKREGLQQTATAVAASLGPLVALQGQVPEITERSLQGAVRDIVKNRDLRFVAISNTAGNVVASSDLTLVGRPLATPNNMLVATASIGEDSSIGNVALGMQTGE